MRSSRSSGPEARRPPGWPPGGPRRTPRYAERVEPEPGEEIFFHGHPSWRSILGMYLKGVIIVILAGAIAGIITRASSRSVDAAWVALVVAVGLMLVLIAGLLRRIATTY